MKMEHVLSAPSAGRVRAVVTQAGASAAIGADLILMEEFAASGEQFQGASTEKIDSNSPRVDLAEVLRRIRLTTDGGRSEHDKNFVKRLEDRHRRGQRSARENLEDLVDVDSFVEIGRLVVAAQRRRRDLEDLVRSTPADGLVAGFATINAGDFGDARARVAVVAYDYTVLAGTQGYYSHKKCDRMLELALEQRLPMVWFCEGGGGRPGDVDTFDVVGSGLTSALWTGLGRLSGLVPLVGLVSGRCFAGNAAALGCCDVVIAVEGSNIGMGGPAMIEGGGLGSVKPEEIGPLSVQLRNGVVDIAVSDEAAAVAAARRYLSYFQGSLPLQRQTGCSDQRLLRSAVPENRFRGYDMRPLIETLVDIGSWLELRSAFAIGVHTGLARIEGRPVGICANNPMHLGGALDADAALKASRFMELCDAFSLPLLFLCDTPGFMVGVESEDQASVRKMCRMFVVAASLTVPVVTIVTRKAYGLGAQAMFGGHSMGRKGLTVSWPTGEFGGMGLEGAVRLGFKKELESIPDPAEREQLFKTLTAGLLERGKALSTAALLEVDDVIDPADSRKLVLCSFAPEESQPRWHRKRPCIGTW
ncbi:unnamed protein product [Polarella glacialis]|uniref:Propionyl-CoA carboxylase beta chain, mitochondrial n=1 Tax=Polarella glacialis TaxID=89957 RepID=A0A813EYE4_POLGL|nr:unnamed protein product [Polarella glacialis]